MDAVVIGGGFYGGCLAAFLAERFRRVLLVEKEPDLLTRASFVNQARVHNGYHYPRSFMTALRSVVNFPRFVLEFRNCIDDGFEKIYAIARDLSKVNAHQFEKLCRNTGAPVKPAAPAVRNLFNSDLVEAVFQVREYAFDAVKLRRILRERLARCDVEVAVGCEAKRVAELPGDLLSVQLAGGAALRARHVFNCTYSGINMMLRNSELPALPLKQEVAEIALIEPPAPLRRLGVTVMDGPFFSTMPFPALGVHSLSHVRYTPHDSWDDARTTRDPDQSLLGGMLQSRFTYMVKDAQRYLPCLADARYVRSLFEVKSMLMRNEVDDGRPILLHRHSELGSFWTVMGGKIDNVYDVLEALGRLRDFTAGDCM